MQQTNSPKISVLMPIYNTNEEHLRQAIESILSQTFTDFEFLILNDSPENKKLDDIVSSYHDSRIKYFKNEQNLGISQSRNKLINLSSGEYLAVFDHDDISLPDRFKKEVDFLSSHPDIGVVSASIIMNQKAHNFPQSDIKIKIALMHDCALKHPAAMIRKEVLLKNNIFYEEEFSPAEDYMLWCRLIKVTKFHNLPDVLLEYRNHKNNTSHNQQEKMRQKTFQIWSFVRKEYPWLYQAYLEQGIDIVKLFGIPLLKIKKNDKKTKVFLFNFIPILKIIKKQEGN